jgi:hypothetical protein|tara:strand:- start:716 stop:1369 length:654 start_codon:yes stop_codon:yes gene_type:complete
MRFLFFITLTIFLVSCSKPKVEMISLNPNIKSISSENKKIWDVFDRKINILIIDDRVNKFKLEENLQQYQKDRIIYLDEGKIAYLDEVIGYKKYNKDETTYLALDQNIMPVLRSELAKGLRDKGFAIVEDNYDRILTLILEDFSYITKKNGFFTDSQLYLKLKVKSGLYDKSYDIIISDKHFLNSSIENDKKTINNTIKNVILSILNNRKLILMLQG